MGPAGKKDQREPIDIQGSLFPRLRTMLPSKQVIRQREPEICLDEQGTSVVAQVQEG